VKDHLVDKALNWPGFNALPYLLNDRPVVAKRLTRAPTVGIEPGRAHL
jgi:hypothetical protein